MKNLLNLRTILLILYFLSFNTYAVPDPDIYGWKYTFDTYEGAYYNGIKIYSDKIYTSHNSSENYLNKLSNKRYNAIEKPIKEKLKQLVYEAAEDAHASVKYFSAGLKGNMKISFTPNPSVPSVLDFTIDGIDMASTTRIKKSPFAKGTVSVDINNFSITGTLDYFNGEVNIASVNGDIDYDVDLDFSIPILDVVLDPLLDYFVDLKVDELPTSLAEFYSADSLPSISLMGISDMIPDGKLIYNGMDYGPILREKILYESIIGDDIEITIGSPIVKNQYFELLIGNLSYKRWVSWTRTICRLGEDRYCFPQGI